MTIVVTHTYDPPTGDSKVVDVTFTGVEGSTTFTNVRTVNAVFTEEEYDASATETRVTEVGRGVKNKIEVGMLSSS